LKWCGTTIDVLLLIPESSWWFIWCSSVRSRIDAAIQLLQYFFALCVHRFWFWCSDNVFMYTLVVVVYVCAAR
jgi:hypothetical protein